MKKYLALVRKDLFIMKNNLPFMALIILGVPLLFLTTAPMGTGLAAFSMTYILALYMTVQSLAYYDSKYRKAESVLNSASYSRQAIVISRYIVSLLIYFITLIVYVIMSLIIAELALLTVTDALISLFVGSAIVGVLQPLTYRFGIEKIRYINAIIMIGISVALPFSIREAGEKLDLTLLEGLSSTSVISVTLLASIIILVVSAIISIKVYKNKEF